MSKINTTQSPDAKAEAESEVKNVGTSGLRGNIKENSKGKEKTQPSQQDTSSSSKTNRRSTVCDCIPKISGKTQPRSKEKEKEKTQLSNQDTSSSRTKKKTVCDYIQKISGKTKPFKDPSTGSSTTMKTKELQNPDSATASRKISIDTHEKEKTQISIDTQEKVKTQNAATASSSIEKTQKEQTQKTATASSGIEKTQKSASASSSREQTQKDATATKAAEKAATQKAATATKAAEKAATQKVATATATANIQEKEKTQHTTQVKEEAKPFQDNSWSNDRDHIVWKGFHEPKIKEKCCLCDGDLTYRETAVLCCGHVFHSHCFQFATAEENSIDPQCMICTSL